MSVAALEFPHPKRIIIQMALIVSILAVTIQANSLKPMTTQTGVIQTSSGSITSKIVGNNRIVVGFSFQPFNFKSVYPYFSMDIKNAHNPSFHPLENHHLYSGIFLLGLGKLTNKHYLRTIGTVLIIDDLIEHGFNVKSALNFTADKIDHRFYSRLTASADRLFK